MKSWQLVFGDDHGVLYQDQNGKIIAGEYYAVLLVQLQLAIKTKSPQLVKKQVLLPHDNAQVVKSSVVVADLQ